MNNLPATTWCNVKIRKQMFLSKNNKFSHYYYVMYLDGIPVVFYTQMEFLLMSYLNAVDKILNEARGENGGLEELIMVAINLYLESQK